MNGTYAFTAFVCTMFGVWMGRRKYRKLATYDDLVDAETRAFEAEEALAAVRDEMIVGGWSIEPIEGESYHGRQYGYRILKDGRPMFDAYTGGTGPCWNLDDAEERQDEFDDIIPLHVCDLSEMIEALAFLRASEAHKKNEERWS